jgi:hypothetical protein
MNHVEGEDQRDLQSRLLDRDRLQLVDVLHAADVQRRPEEALARQVDVLRTIRPLSSAVELLQLPELLVERHPREERIDPAVLGPLPKWSGARKRHDAKDCDRSPRAAETT